MNISNGDRQWGRYSWRRERDTTTTGDQKRDPTPWWSEERRERTTSPNYSDEARNSMKASKRLARSMYNNYAAEYSRHVRAIPWPFGWWCARRRINTGHAGRLHGREHAWGHVQPRCRSRGGMGLGKGWRHRHRSGGGPLAWRNAHGRGRHPATQRTCARRAGRPTRHKAGRVGSTAARRSACNRTGRCRQQPPTRRRNRSRRAGTITYGASGRFDPQKSLRAVAARNSGRWGGTGGQAPSGPCDPCGRTVLFSHVFSFAFSVIATLATLTRLQIPED